MATLHFLRTVTKMYYGGGTNAGNPPPVCRLNGYGDYVYKDVPIVITNFTVELREQVDYIGVNVPTGPNQSAINEALVGTVDPGLTADAGYIQGSNVTSAVESSGSVNYVPTDSLISITVVPVYSRNKISTQFNLKDFASGSLTKNEGFI